MFESLDSIFPYAIAIIWAILLTIIIIKNIRIAKKLKPYKRARVIYKEWFRSIIRYKPLEARVNGNADLIIFNTEGIILTAPWFFRWAMEEDNTFVSYKDIINFYYDSYKSNKVLVIETNNNRKFGFLRTNNKRIEELLVKYCERNEV